MKLIGLEDCSTCKIAKKFFLDVPYIELKKGKITEQIQEITMIKKALGKLNPTGHFPVMLNDNYTKIVETDKLLENLSKNKIQQLLET